MDSANPINAPVPKMENPFGFEWYSFEDTTFEKIFDELPQEEEVLFELENFSFVGGMKDSSQALKDWEILNGDAFFTGCDDNSSLNEEAVMLDEKPLMVVNTFGQYRDTIKTNLCTGIQSQMTRVQTDDASASVTKELGRRGVVGGRKKSAPLELEEIHKHFDVPITKAAKNMKVGVTVLKKRCRELNIMRWPHRKIKSLDSLINNVKELGMDEEIVMLEEHKRLIEKLPDVELTERAKKLRQACFKANYKKRRFLASQA